MKKLCLSILLLVNGYMLFAQQKQLSIQDAMLNARTTLAPQTLKQVQFVKGSNDYIYIKKIGGVDTWVRGNFKSKEEQPFLTLHQFNQRLKNAKVDSLAALPPTEFNIDNWIVSIKGVKYQFSSTDQSYTVLQNKELGAKQNLDKSSDGYFAYLQDHNLFVVKDNDSVQVTSDGSANIVYASSVHREEFGISKGTFWSNNGKLLAFYRMDQSMVTDYPIIDWTAYPAKNENIKYPMAGGKSHQVTLGIYNAVTKKTNWVKTGMPADTYLTNIAWGPDDRFVYIALVNREQNHMWLNQYDATTGNFVKTLFEETDPKYTEPQQPMLFVKNNPSRFIWQSRRDGWNHLYLYDVNGSLIRQLTRGEWEVTDLKGFDKKGEHLLYVSTQGSPLTRNLYQLHMKKYSSEPLTRGPGLHNTIINSDGTYVIDNFSDPSNPRTIRLIETKSGKSKILLQSSNPLAGYDLGQLSISGITAKDGTVLYSRMFKPVGFDSSKKYPVLVYWYGGPHAQMITESWNGGSGDYWFQYMAGKGFIVYTIDTRGSANRGRAFEQSQFRKLGAVQMEDMEAAVNYLHSLPYVNKDKMALFGWSFGGFMTTSFVLNHPGVFKAAVAGGPVMDWKYYEIMYGERYMDTPQENPEGYEATNLIKQAGKLKDKLLLIHGLQDPVVVQQHSVNFVKAAVDAGVQVDYMIYPGHEHNVLGKDRAHLFQKITDFIQLHLK